MRGAKGRGEYKDLFLTTDDTDDTDKELEVQSPTNGVFDLKPSPTFGIIEIP